MKKETSPAKDIKIYALGFIGLVTPILIFFGLNLGYGECFAIGSYVTSSQNFIKPINSSLLALFQPSYALLFTYAISFFWFLGGLIFLSFSISSVFVRSWSSRKKILAVCGLTGYILTYAWIGFNPPQHQIEYALHSKISIGYSPPQVIKVLSSQNICHDDTTNDDVLEAYIPADWENDSTYIITFHFTKNKLQNFTIDQQRWYDEIKK